ncbi:MAG: hypothetical protein MMC23_008148 [Stictis urceolatum]|nr:hypothetical protein [Stictis urceolata]
MSFLSDLATNIPGYGRAAKRQKTESPTSPRPSRSATPNPRPSKKAAGSGGKSVLVYGSTKGDRSSGDHRPQLAKDQSNNGKAPQGDSSFTDSAYQSMTTAQENINEQDFMALDLTPSRKSKQGLVAVVEIPSRKRSGRDETSGSEDELATPVSRLEADGYLHEITSERKSNSVARSENGINVAQTIEGNENASGEDEGPAPRSSRRNRKKSQRQVEAEEADTIIVAARRKSRGTSERVTPMTSKAAPTPRSKVTKSGTKTTAAKRNPVSFNVTPTTSGGRRGRPPKAKTGALSIQKPPDEIPSGDITRHAAILEPIVPEIDVEEPTEQLQPEIQQRPVDQFEEEITVADPSTPSKSRSTKVVNFVPDSPKARPEDPLTIALDSSESDCSVNFAALSNFLDSSETALEYSELRDEILKGLTSKKRLPLVGLKTEYSKVYQLVEQTIVAGEGNSMLVIGSRGSAKTTMVETVLDKMTSLYSEDFHVVRLNGFIHTDDKIALKEIWRQLGREMQVEDEANATRSNYADTLTLLLALLSHPTDLSEEETDKTSKSVIFIIDEFEQFATHPRQTLLYNLFDISQSRKAPIAVLGLTTRIDVTETLEKRVKSRFSHRYVHISLAKTYSTFLEICKTALHATDTPSNSPSALQFAWSAYISSLLSTAPINDSLLLLYYTSKSIPQLFSSLLAAFLLTPHTQAPSPSTFATYLNTLHPPDSKLSLLHGLPTLALALLIAAARLDILLSTDAVTFAMAYEEYVSLTNRTKVVASASGASATSGVGAGRVWGRDVALGAWEALCVVGLLVPVTGEGGKGEGRLWRVDVSLEEVGGECGREELGVMGKWCREMAL